MRYNEFVPLLRGRPHLQGVSLALAFQSKSKIWWNAGTHFQNSPLDCFEIHPLRSALRTKANCQLRWQFALWFDSFAVCTGDFAHCDERPRLCLWTPQAFEKAWPKLLYLRQHRTKTAWKLCTSSACRFPVILHKISLTYASMPASILYNLTKNLTSHLTHNLCAVLP